MARKGGKKKSAGKKRVRKSSVPAPGVTLEKVVARLQQLMDPKSVVTHNEKLVDRIGNERQFDVVIRGTFGGRPMLGVIECKDHDRRKGPDAVEAFAKKCEHVGANLRLMVSKKGFTPQALKLAKHENIGCLSLLPDDTKAAGFRVGVIAYAKYYRWTQTKMVIFYPSEDPPLDFEMHDVLLDGKPVLRWFEKQLMAKYDHTLEEGEFPVECVFREPTILLVNGAPRRVLAITVTGTRRMFKKKRFLSLHGEAFFDWETKMAHMPGGAQTRTQGFTLDLTEWEDFDGDIEHELKNSKQFFTLCFTVSEQTFEESPDAINLEEHAAQASPDETTTNCRGQGGLPEHAQEGV